MENEKIDFDELPAPYELDEFELFFFDLDDTLITTKLEDDRRTGYTRIINPVKKKLWEYYLDCALAASYENIHIITARPVTVYNDLDKLFDNEEIKIHCRPFLTTKGQIKQILENENGEEEYFLEEIIMWKTYVLNSWAQSGYDIYFFDDNWKEFPPERLHPNVIVYNPFTYKKMWRGMMEGWKWEKEEDNLEVKKE